jgi:hypothetical protein
MKLNEGRRKPAAYALVVATVAAYLARPWSCVFTIKRFSSDDPLPYARFDYHGMGAMFACAAALIFAAPMLWIVTEIVLHPTTRLGILGRGRDARTTLLSVVLALALGLPTFSQLGYLIGLPIGVAMPVLLSSVAWLLVVEMIRTAGVQRCLSGNIIRTTAVVALLTFLPKAIFAVVLSL